jgi:hypothetical protein
MNRPWLSRVCNVIVKSKPQQWIGPDFLESATLWKPRHQSTYNEICGAFVQPMLPWKVSKYYIFWVCVCILMCPACAFAISFAVSAAVQYFFTVFRKRHDFRKEKSLNIKACFDIIYNFDQNISHPEKNRTRYVENVYFSSCKVPVILVRF